jgi:5-methylcytosine-specific restriction endonuclease McrA
LVNGKAKRKRKIDDKKRRLFELLCNSECAICGENDPLVLEFDHLFEKKADISTLISSTCSWSELKREMAKCQILCSNCHKRKTHAEANSYRYRYLVAMSVG